MRPVLQTIFPPEGLDGDGIEALPGPQRGNCLQAAIASLLDLPLEDVPHFVALSQEEWWPALEAFFAARNIAVFWQPIGPDHGWAPLGVPYLATGKSPRGEFNHVVVMQDWELLHDPHPSGAGLDGPPKGAYFLLVKDPALSRAVGQKPRHSCSPGLIGSAYGCPACGIGPAALESGSPALDGFVEAPTSRVGPDSRVDPPPQHP